MTSLERDQQSMRFQKYNDLEKRAQCLSNALAELSNRSIIVWANVAEIKLYFHDGCDRPVIKLDFAPDLVSGKELGAILHHYLESKRDAILAAMKAI